MEVEAVRDFALSLPDSTEEPHFHFTSFRINGKIFATMPPSNELLHVFVSEEMRELAVASHPELCEALHWGKRVVGLKVDLANAEQALIEKLLRDAYENKSARAKKK